MWSYCKHLFFSTHAHIPLLHQCGLGSVPVPQLFFEPVTRVSTNEKRFQSTNSGSAWALQKAWFFCTNRNITRGRVEAADNRSNKYGVKTKYIVYGCSLHQK
ncbi:hypothetical protein GOODEAATRI_023482 [Goodea atripinnis]|uniref:Uncharacterized protein n=1 Tax=Goodea atripinnis TaxID=208336 RepID=A0ABV0NYX5_9TELE